MKSASEVPGHQPKSNSGFQFPASDFRNSGGVGQGSGRGRAGVGEGKGSGRADIHKYFFTKVNPEGCRTMDWRHASHNA